MLLLMLLGIHKDLYPRIKDAVVDRYLLPQRAICSYLEENFENWPPSSFTLNPSSGAGAWLQSPLNTTAYISPQEGADNTGHGAEFNCWGYSAGVTGEIISAPVDLSGTSNPAFSFYFWNHTDQAGYGNNDSTIISISTDNGNTWTTLAVLKGNVDNWTLHTYDLSSYIGDTIIVKFTGVSDYGGSNMGIDQVSLGERPSVDAGIGYIVEPDFYLPPDTIHPMCILSSVGTDTCYNVYAVCMIESLGTEVYRDSVLVDTFYTGFNDTVRFSTFTPTAGGCYTFIFYTVFSRDIYPLNDTLTRTARFYTTSRMVIGEVFTNVGCGPCVASNDTLKHILQDYPDRLSIIKYHTRYPSSADPFYQFNISQNRARENYYDAAYTPHVYFDGDIDADAERDQYRELFLNELSKASPIEILLSGIYHPETATGSLYVELNLTGEPADTNLYLRTCLIENGIRYYGPNGETLHYQVFRNMFPDSIGIGLGILHKGDVIRDTIVFYVDTTIIKQDSLQVVTFVQSDANRHILQGARIDVKDMSTGIANPEEVENCCLSVPQVLTTGSKIRVYLNKSNNVKVSMLDVAGRVILPLYRGILKRGYNYIPLSAAGLPRGVYFISVTLGDRNLTRRCIYLK